MKNTLRKIANFVAAQEIWLVSAAVLFSMVQTALLPWAVLVALLFWPIRWAAEGRFFRRTPVDWGIGLFLLMIPVTLWATALPEKTIPQVYRLALGILYFYSIFRWTVRSPKRLGWVVAGLLLAGVGLAATALISVRWTTTKLAFIPASVYQRLETLVSDAIHPNVMAGNLVFFLPIGLALLLFAGKKLKGWQTLLTLVASAILMGILILTQSRGALIGLATALLLLILLRWKWGWVALPLAGLSLGVLIAQIGLPTLFDFVASGVSVDGIEGRVEIWSRAIYMIQDFSFTGVGIGSYMEVADLLYPFFLAAPGKVEHAHNLPLQVAVDLGIPGLVAWLAIYLGVSFSGWQLYRYGKTQKDGWAAGLGAGFLGSQLALITHGLMDAVTWGMIRPAPLVWAVWGATIAAQMLIVPPAPRQTTASEG